MQSEVIRSSRLGALVAGLTPTFVAFLFLKAIIGDGSPPVFILVLSTVFAVVSLASLVEVVKPRELELDRRGLIFRPTFGPSRHIPWSAITAFSTVGKKPKLIVSEYIDPATGQPAKVKLGGRWALPQSGLWYADSAQVVAYLAEQRTSSSYYPSSSSPSPQTADATQKASRKLASQVGSTTRSGAVYASATPDTAKPRLVGLGGPRKTAKGLGWALLIGAGIVATLSAVPFMAACKAGLCSVAVWELGDVRIWGFALLWTGCLLVALFGGRILMSD